MLLVHHDDEPRRAALGRDVRGAIGRRRTHEDERRRPDERAGVAVERGEHLLNNELTRHPVEGTQLGFRGNHVIERLAHGLKPSRGPQPKAPARPRSAASDADDRRPQCWTRAWPGGHWEWSGTTADSSC